MASQYKALRILALVLPFSCFGMYQQRDNSPKIKPSIGTLYVLYPVVTTMPECQNAHASDPCGLC